MSRYFYHNLETDKIVIVCTKAEWLSFPEADRASIKNACLWSGRLKCWVSRCKGGKHRFWPLDILLRLGFEDRGTEGERLSLPERIEAQQEKAEARAERFDELAAKRQAEGNALHQTAHEMASVIPFGQPILVGHHSEKRDRNYRERIHNKFRKAFETMDKAAYFRERAAVSRRSSNGLQYSDPRYLGNRIAEREEALRKLGAQLERDNLTPEWREDCERRYAAAEEELEFFKHCLETCGKPVFDKKTLDGKKHVRIRGRWCEILRLNRLTVAVPNLAFPTIEGQRKYAMKYKYTEVEEAR